MRAGCALFTPERKPMLPRWTPLVICLAAALGAASPAAADTVQVPGDFPKIQQAVDAASPGDVIAVAKKLNKENVVVNTQRLTIKGVAKGVTVDALAGGNGFAFDVNAADVAVRNLLVKHGDGIDCTADGCTFSRLRFGGDSEFDCIRIIGNGGTVTDSRLVACGDNAVEIQGTRATVLGNSIRLIDNECIFVVGNRARIRGNVAGRCEDSEAIDYEGNDATIADNELHNVEGDVIDLAGDRIQALGNAMANGANACLRLAGNEALIKGNRGRACRQGFKITGENPRVIANRMVETVGDSEGIDVDCTIACGDGVVRNNLAADTVDDDDGFDVTVAAGTGSFEVVGNVARNNADMGFDLKIPAGVVRDNLAVANGFEREDAFSILGDGARVLDNRALGNGGDGIALGSTSMIVRSNLARGNHLDGFQIDGIGLALTENDAIDNFGDGIDNDGLLTELRRNVARGNQVDCANSLAGTIAVKQRNRCADGSNFNVPGQV
jgi:hypothetical protein